jgi:hypothetical protein
MIRLPLYVRGRVCDVYQFPPPPLRPPVVLGERVVGDAVCGEEAPPVQPRRPVVLDVDGEGG